MTAARLEPKRPLRVLGVSGWLRWEFVERRPLWTTYVLHFGGEQKELEDFGEV